MDRNDHEIKVEINCGSLQPGRRVWTDTFFAGMRESGQTTISGHIFASNLRKPLDFNLRFDATITESAMTLQEVISLGESEDDEDNDDE